MARSGNHGPLHGHVQAVHVVVSRPRRRMDARSCNAVCGYILDRVMSDDINIDAVLDIVDAISFAHDATSTTWTRFPSPQWFNLRAA